MGSTMDSKAIYQFKNCQIIRGHKILSEDLWVRNGKIINPEPLFFEERKAADFQFDCAGFYIAPGGLGFDFADVNIDIENAVTAVAKNLVKHGVTAFCPTLVTISEDSYHKILPRIKRRAGNAEYGATVLGVHLEGPFINPNKCGAHDAQHIRGNEIKSVDEILSFYRHLDDTAIITLAPELDSGTIIKDLVNKQIIVSIGHSTANLTEGEAAINNGANFITHLFNAMLPFHHRDPGLVGLLTSSKVNKPTVYYGIIADGNHTHVTALNIAYRSNPKGLVLVTDAISAMGLPSGSKMKTGTQNVEIRGNKAFIEGTQTLCGSIATMDECVRNLKKWTNCSIVEAVECASLHPASVLGIENTKGTLNFGCDADFVLLDRSLNVEATFINGRCVYNSHRCVYFS
ncbi:N-acetylglucosamine-6-phosphate deacetylase-like protein [Leptotrombidium deliense]|uniref:N-acetylglucosamine-6-phosphate deacetylase n=1 Tax=Leptotrombidium deliense TaxID=299467 RepID=A0A443SKP4_9ACAR|nr:N-acetylglucosamine-6-phosphate deacetylase-like protein [Leptotrombidium deliense]